MVNALDMYSDLRTGWKVFGLVGFIIAFFQGLIMFLSAGAGLLAAVIWLVVCYLTASWWAKKRMEKMDKIYRDDCQIQMYIEMMIRLQKSCQNDKKTYRKILNYIAFELTEACLVCGQAEEAYVHLPEYAVSGIKEENVAWKLRYNTLLFEYYLLKKDAEKAENTLAELKELMGIDLQTRAKADENKQVLYQEKYAYFKMMLDIETGFPQDAERSALLTQKENSRMQDRVAGAYVMGIIYAQQNETEKAKVYMKYAAENGRDMYCAQEAKKWLG